MIVRLIRRNRTKTAYSL